MASSNDISVNAKISIDNKGLGIVKEIVHRGFDNFYLVKLVDIDFEVELPSDRLTLVNMMLAMKTLVANRQQNKPADLPPGYEHARNILMTSRASLNWIICENIEDARRLQRDFRPDIKCGTSDQFEQAINDSSVAGVLVSSPTQTHERFTKMSLEAGKAVMCEKPLTSSLETTAQCYELAEKNKKPLLCAFQRRFDSSIYKMYSQIHSGSLGNIRIIKSISRDWPFPPFDYLQGSGGIFVDSTVHDLDICSWIAGSKPKTLYAQGSVFQRDKMPSGDNEQVVVVVTYENGAVSVTDNGRFCPFGYDQRMEVLCDKSMLTVENKTVDQVMSHGATDSTIPRIEANFMARYKDAYRNELDHFLDVIEGKSELRITKEDTLRTMKLVTLCYESAKLGQVVKYTD